MEAFIAITGIVFGNLSFLALIFVFWKLRQRKFELQADVQTRMIDKLTSSPEMVNFLQSPAGREFVNGVQIGAMVQSRERVLESIRRAIVLLFLGLAFAGLWLASERSFGFAVPALIFIALGAGNLVAAFVSLSVGRRLGINMEQIPQS